MGVHGRRARGCGGLLQRLKASHTLAVPGVVVRFEEPGVTCEAVDRLEVSIWRPHFGLWHAPRADRPAGRVCGARACIVMRVQRSRLVAIVVILLFRRDSYPHSELSSRDVVYDGPGLSVAS